MADAASHASYLPPILTFCAGAVIAVPLFRKLGQSAVLGYLAAGVIIGPSVLSVIKDPDAIRGTAEIGVVLLLFLVGLELQPSRLYSMRRDILGLGLAQMGLSAAVIGLVGWRLGLSAGGAVAVGVALALSATSIALQLLEERGDGNETYGRRTFSILLFQDMAIAPVLALLPCSRRPRPRPAARCGRWAASASRSQPSSRSSSPDATCSTRSSASSPTAAPRK